MTQTTDTPVYRALSMLENEYEPILRRRSPFWRPRPAPPARDVHTPSWSWTHPEYSDDLGMDLTFLDYCAAYVSAASSAGFAHGELEHTGAMSRPSKFPGYYRIDSHAWPDPRIVSPLGSADVEGKLWIAAPTLELLQQLSAKGFWPEVRIHDSWTCPDTVRFREWATAVNTDRAEALRRIEWAETEGTEADQAEAYDRYESIKTGYSMAVQMMRGPAKDAAVKSGVKRPDWYSTIHAQHAATVWRTVWKCITEGGKTPVMMGNVDEIVWDTQDFTDLTRRDQPLLKMDQSGISLGHWKIKQRLIAGEVIGS